MEAGGGTEESETAVAKDCAGWPACKRPTAAGGSISSRGRSATPPAPAWACCCLGPPVRRIRRASIKRRSTALQWLKDNQESDGDLRGEGGGNMYAHGICSIALCEAYALTRDPDLRQPAQRAIDFIVQSQNNGGGCRYDPGQQGDMSVVGWQIMGAQVGPDGVSRRAGEDARPGEEVPRQRRRTRARPCRYDMARYAYQPGTGITEVMTAEAMLCRQYTGWKRTEPAMGTRSAGCSPTTCRPRATTTSTTGTDGTQMMHHYGGEPWKKWNGQVRDLLVASQVRAHRVGRQLEPCRPLGDAGRAYLHHFASLLTLEVYYRHLPSTTPWRRKSAPSSRQGAGAAATGATATARRWIDFFDVHSPGDRGRSRGVFSTCGCARCGRRTRSSTRRPFNLCCRSCAIRRCRNPTSGRCVCPTARRSASRGLAIRRLKLSSSPPSIKDGGGKLLVEHARTLKRRPLTVDVNEQNPACCASTRSAASWW